jgi:hypothetical protein
MVIARRMEKIQVKAVTLRILRTAEENTDEGIKNTKV